jgi:bla regulator protein blaR1
METTVIKALCWTLIHSLWIGHLIALLAGLVLVLTRRLSSAIRYQLLCGVMLLFLFSTAFTFYTEFASGCPPINATVATTAVTTIHFTPTATITQTPVMTTAVALIDRYIVWLFFTWLLCLLIKSTRLIGGLFAMQQIRSDSSDNIPADWHQKIVDYSEKLGITRKIRLLQSAKISVPATVGFFSPVVLLPLDLLLQLTPGQAKSILWHELAHIARRDYLTGLLQETIETIFFFNPALLWLSELIREEREKCCDDTVIAHTAKKGAYLEALLAFQTSPALKLAIPLTTLRKGQLRNRLNRLLGRKAPLFSFAERLLLLTALIFISGLLLMAKPVKTNLVHKAAYHQKVPEPVIFAKHQFIKIKSPNPKAATTPPLILSDQDRVKTVIAALIKEQVVPDATTLDWFGLSDTELVVNGEKQPAALQQKLKALVSVGPGNGLYFGPVQMTGQGVFIEKKEL